MTTIKITPRGILKPKAILDLTELEKKLSGNGHIRYTMYDLESCIANVRKLEQPDRDTGIKVLAKWGAGLISGYNRNLSFRARRDSLTALAELGPLAGADAFVALFDAIHIHEVKPAIDYATAKVLAENLAVNTGRINFRALHDGVARTDGSWDWVDIQQITMTAVDKIREVYTYPLINIMEPYVQAIRKYVSGQTAQGMEITKVARRIYRMYLATGVPLEPYDISRMLSLCEGGMRIVTDADGVRFEFKTAGDWEVHNESKES